MGSRRLRGRVVAVAGAGALLATFAVWSPSQAQTASPLCFSATAPETEIFPDQVDAAEIVGRTDLPVVTLNQFDPALGTLTSVTLNVTLSASQQMALFNQGDLDVSGSIETSASGLVTSSAAGSLSQSVVASLTGTFMDLLPRQEITVTATGSATASTTSTNGAVLTALTGTGTTGFTVSAASDPDPVITPDTVNPELSPALATVRVEVCYAFQPAAVTTTAAPTTAAPTTTPATTSGPVTLPNTGSSGETGMAWFAAALVLAGGSLLVVARRRDSAS